MEPLIAIAILIALVVAVRYLWKQEQQTPRESDLRVRLRDISRMSGVEFERYMARVYQALGYNVTILGGSGDQGVDLLLRKGRVLVAVQCKNHQRPVGNKPVQEVYAGQRHYGANQAWVVAPAGFTKGAFALSRTTGVRLFDYGSIEKLLRQVEQRTEEQQTKEQQAEGRIEEQQTEERWSQKLRSLFFRQQAEEQWVEEPRAREQQAKEQISFAEITNSGDPSPADSKKQVSSPQAAKKKKPAKKKESAKQEELAPINLSGFNQAATTTFDLQSGLTIFRLTHQGSGHFSGTLLDQNGQRAYGMASLLANVVGPFDGSKALQTKSGQHLIEVLADGPWTITIEQPRPYSAPQITNFQGNYQTATEFFQLSQGLKRFEMTHQGKGHFSVTLLKKEGSRLGGIKGLLANKVGPFAGSKAVHIPREDVYLLQVNANGPWSVRVK